MHDIIVSLSDMPCCKWLSMKLKEQEAKGKLAVSCSERGKPAAAAADS